MARLHDILGYEVIGELGHGARSTIYAVKDRRGQLYALKHVIRGESKDQRFLDQAILEHKVASQLNHPCLRRSFKLIRQRRILRISEVFVLMEMIDGSTLEHYQRPDLIELCRICGKIADGLESMHDAGYVHADIKPNNVMITDDMQVKIIDFGQSCPSGTVKQRIQGTPDYIAPEQVRRKSITPRTDVFNFGATMYWMLTERHIKTMIPTKGDRDEPLDPEPTPPPHALRPQIPMALSALVMQCIEPRASNRPESMGRVRDRIDLAVGQLQRNGSGPTATTV
jgi:serine/threonine protein kinase